MGNIALHIPRRNYSIDEGWVAFDFPPSQIYLCVEITVSFRISSTFPNGVSKYSGLILLRNYTMDNFLEGWVQAGQNPSKICLLS